MAGIEDVDEASVDCGCWLGFGSVAVGDGGSAFLMDDRERLALVDYFTLAAWEAGEALQEALADLREELLGEGLEGGSD